MCGRAVIIDAYEARSSPRRRSIRKLVKGNYVPFRNELAAQTGNGITEANAAILMQLVNALDTP